MSSSEQNMTPAQSVALLDAALRCRDPLTFLDSVVTALMATGRQRGAIATAWIGCLYAEGEIEVLMALRAAWARGEDASPREAARSAARAQSVAADEGAPRWEGRGWR